MAIKVKPIPLITDHVDDTQTIGDVEQIYQSFVVPIDTRVRSIQDCGTGDIVAQNPRGDATEEEKRASRVVGGSVDPFRYNESRCHAFFRNIGFPVVSPNGSFYNDGHDPHRSVAESTRSSVDMTLYLNNDLIRLIKAREDNVKERRDIFAKQDEVATAYALMLCKPRPFLSAKTGENPFFIDWQSTPIESRKQELESLNVTNVPNIVTDVSHILKPFIVDPYLAGSVEPEQTKRVAVPFLASPGELSTGVDEKGNKTMAIRPLLEQVIYNRLQVKETDTGFITVAKKLLDSPKKVISEDVKTTLLALSGKNSLEYVGQDIIDSIQDFTTLESTIAKTLIKGIKFSVNELNLSAIDLAKVRSRISFQPIVDVNGPEFPQGGKIHTANWVVEQSEAKRNEAILHLQQVLNESLQGKSDSRIGNRTYISGISVDLTKDLKPSIGNIKREIDELGRLSLNLLANIEKITGEISGLGIIDILAVHTALYTIDMRYLIGFLDDASLLRLKQNFSELATDEVNSQINSARPPIIECLTEFEKVFFNILAFADSLTVMSAQTPIKARKGSPTG